MKEITRSKDYQSIPCKTLRFGWLRPTKRWLLASRARLYLTGKWNGCSCSKIL